MPGSTHHQVLIVGGGTAGITVSAILKRRAVGINLAIVGRVEDWRAGLGRCSCSLLSRPFVCECHSISTMPRFQSPPRRTQRADFPLYALLFASPQGLWDLSCRGDFRL